MRNNQCYASSGTSPDASQLPDVDCSEGCLFVLVLAPLGDVLSQYSETPSKVVTWDAKLFPAKVEIWPGSEEFSEKRCSEENQRISALDGGALLMGMSWLAIMGIHSMSSQSTLCSQNQSRTSSIISPVCISSMLG